MTAAETARNPLRDAHLPGHQGDSPRFDIVADLVIVGAGGAGLPAALYAKSLGNDVVVLEKASVAGGTALKSGFGVWVPNNRLMRQAGMEDPREDYLRFVARVSRPERYDADAPFFGLTAWEHDMVCAIYDSAGDALERLCQITGLEFEIHNTLSPEYYGKLAECTPKLGRSLSPQGAFGPTGNGGQLVLERMIEVTQNLGVPIWTDSPVTDLVIHDGSVLGVVASRHGTPTRLGARKAVIFASGGFSRNEEMRETFLSTPTFKGCGASTNEGDFVRISAPLRVQLGNMNYAWMCPVSLEKSLDPDNERPAAFFLAGDSMLMVNAYGRRVTNEKLPYNELAQAFGVWDPRQAEYPNRVLIQLWDQRSQDHSAGRAGTLITPPGEGDEHVITAPTLDELAAAIDERLRRYSSSVGNLRLAEDFVATLRDTVERFNACAEAGYDEDFQRGESAIEVALNGFVKEEPDRRNPTMWPLSTRGPYYAALVAPGTLDTKGGPRTTRDGQVVTESGRPIEGLYGIGNCVASPSGRAYWGAGGTLGPILAFAYRAARSAGEQPARTSLVAASVRGSEPWSDREAVN